MAPRALASMSALLLGALAALAPPPLRAQTTATLGGRVTVDGAPASDVSVFLAGTTRGAVTGDDGRYQIAGIAAGSYVAGLTPRTELFGRVNNLTDAAYAELVTYDAFQKDQITPGAPRSVYVGLKTSW